MELSVVTLWSAFSRIHAELVAYLDAEAFPLATRFVWVVNTDGLDTRRLLDDARTRLQGRGHDVDIVHCLDAMGQGLLAKHQHVAHLYNLALPRLATQKVLFIEDDNLPTPGAYVRAAATLAGNPQCGAVSALYRSRRNPACACAAFALDQWDNLPTYAKVPRRPLVVGFVGGGFTLYRLAALRSGLPLHAEFVGANIHGWDACLCLKMREHGWSILLDGEIRVGHHCPEVIAWCARSGQPIA